MYPRDCAASAKAGFFIGRFQALAPALALAMVLGCGLSAASFNAMFNDSHASAHAIQANQSLPAEPAVASVAVNSTASTMPPLKARAGPSEAPHQTWSQRSERDVTGLEGAGCTAECLQTLRQRLLDHHRQAAPVWVF